MNALAKLVAGLEQDLSLDVPNRLRERVAALDRLEAYLVDEPAAGAGAAGVAAAALIDRARSLSARLEAVNNELFGSIRRDVRRGNGAAGLAEWAAAGCAAARAAAPASGDDYDYLDVLVSGILQLAAPAADLTDLAPGMVAYQPTPARHIFDLIDRAALAERDVLVDLGSGLGHVPLLVSICTGGRGIGIELEAPYVDVARRSARELGLTNTAFVRQDARAADLSLGTLFYLYTPFTGAVLRAVLESLRREAARREIRVGTYGPCTLVVADEPWLKWAERPQADRIALFRSRR